MDPRTSTSHLMSSQQQQIPSNHQQTYIKSSSGYKYPKNENTQFTNQANRQSEFQSSPRFGRSVATVIPMNSKSLSTESSKNGCQDAFPRAQMMYPSFQMYDATSGDPCAFQTLHRINSCGPSKGNFSSASSYQPMTSSMMVGIRDPSHGIREPSQNCNQLSLDMIQPPMRRFPLQQQMTGGYGARFIPNQYPIDIAQKMTLDCMSSGDIEIRGMNPAYNAIGPSCKLMHMMQHRQALRQPMEPNNKNPNQFSDSQIPCQPINSSPRNPMMFVSMNSKLEDNAFENQTMSTGMFSTVAHSGSLMNSSQNVHSSRVNSLHARTNTSNSTTFRDGPSLFPLSVCPTQTISLPNPGTICALCSKEISIPPEKLKESTTTPICRQQHLPPIQCEAGCRDWFHLLCSGLTLDAFFLLKSEPMAEWLCNTCAALAYPNIPYIRLRQ